MATYSFSSFRFNTLNGRLTSDTISQTLRPKTADLLTYFLQQPERIITKQELLEQVWPNTSVTEQTLTQSIKELRKALGDPAKDPKFIRTQTRRGYTWLIKPELTDAQKIAGGSSWQRLKVLVAPAAILFILLLIGVFYLNTSYDDKEKLTNTTSVALLPFSNNTGNDKMAWLEFGLQGMVAQHLASKPYIALAPAFEVENVIAQTKTYSKHFNQRQLKQLLPMLDTNYLIHANVKTVDSQYEINYQFVTNGQISEGILIYNDLGAAAFNLAEKFTKFANPKIARSEGKKQSFSTSKFANEFMAQGIHLYRTEGPKKAKGLFEKALFHDNELEQARIYLAKCHFLLGHWTLARQHLTVLAQSSHDTIKLEASLELAKLLLYQEQVAPLQQLIKNAVMLARKTKNQAALVKALHIKGELLSRQGKWQQQQQLSQEAKKLSQSSQDLDLIFDSFYQSGKLNSPSDDSNKRISELRNALSFYRQKNNMRGMANTYLALGTKKSLSMQQRQDYHLESLKLYQKTGDKVGEGVAYNSLAWYHLQQFEPEQALDYAQKALALHQDMGAKIASLMDQFYIAFAYLDLGSLRHDLYNKPYLAQASELLQKSLQGFYQYQLMERIPITHLLLATIYTDMGDFTAADAQLAEATAFIEGYQGQGLELMIKLSKVLIDIRKEDWPSVLTKVNSIEADFHDHPILLRILARAQYENNQFKQATSTMKKLKKVVGPNWHKQDQLRLQLYKMSVDNQQKSNLESFPNLYILYILYLSSY